MRGKLWKYLAPMPEGLDFGGILIGYLLYTTCILIALLGFLILVTAFGSHMEFQQRMMLTGASLVALGAAYALRLLTLWMLKKKIQLYRYLGL